MSYSCKLSNCRLFFSCVIDQLICKKNFEGVPILESLVRSLRHPSIALSIVLQKATLPSSFPHYHLNCSYQIMSLFLAPSFFLSQNFGFKLLTVDVLLQELEKSDCVALRNNIVVMMADFCVRYTALVDW